MKKSFEDKIRSLVKSEQKQSGKKIDHVDVKVMPRIGYTGEEQIIVNYYTKD